MKVFEFLGRIMWSFWIINHLLYILIKPPVLNFVLQEICNCFGPHLLKYFLAVKFLGGFLNGKRVLVRFSRFRLVLLVVFFHHCSTHQVASVVTISIWRCMDAWFCSACSTSNQPSYPVAVRNKEVKPHQDEVVVSFLHNVDTLH